MDLHQSININYCPHQVEFLIDSSTNTSEIFAYLWGPLFETEQYLVKGA